MAGGSKRWAAQVSDESKVSAMQHAMDRGAVGLLNAREDVRQKLVDEAWFGRNTVSNEASLNAWDTNPAQEQGGIHGQSTDAHAGTVWDQEGHTQDFYQNPNWESVKEASLDGEGVDGLGHNRDQQTAWEAQQVEAHELYGQEPEDREPEM